MLPNLIVIGAGKAGTTSLWAYLDTHPDVFMSAQKELDFFTLEHNWHLGQAWYESHFEGVRGEAVVGEVSGNYTNWPASEGVPDRMADLVPDARLVYVLRDPIERIVSAYRYYRARGEEDLPVERAVFEVPIYLSVSSYATQLEQFLRRFPREQVHLLTSEDLRDDRAATMAGVFRFLGIDPDPPVGSFDHEYNLTERKRFQPRAAVKLARRVPGYDALAALAPAGARRAVRRFGKVEVLTADDGRLPDDVRARLVEALADDTRRLRTHLGDDFHCWGLV